MMSNLGWASDTPELFCATFCPEWGSKRHLIVEAIPGGGWDWSAWAADGSGRCLHGRADSPAHAMEAAERAALILGRSPVVDLDTARSWLLHSEFGRPN